MNVSAEHLLSFPLLKLLNTFIYIFYQYYKANQFIHDHAIFSFPGEAQKIYHFLIYF